jgi:hypothetical protein
MQNITSPETEIATMTETMMSNLSQEYNNIVTLDHDDNVYKLFTIYAGGIGMGMLIFIMLFLLRHKMRRLCTKTIEDVSNTPDDETYTPDGVTNAPDEVQV